MNRETPTFTHEGYLLRPARHADAEAYYAHTPGLKVVTPATPEDAYHLLREAIASPDPVVFREPKKLYWAKEEVDFDRPVPALG